MRGDYRCTTQKRPEESAMLTASDIGGMMAMMPAFATDGATDIRATDTVSVERLRSGLDRMVSDGADVIATTGSFGECHTLLPEEFRTLAHESVAVVRRRVPLFVGVTSVNARETVAKMRVVADTAADGVLLGVPYYFPSTVENAVRFFRDIAELFPKLNILVYHNPALHHVTLPVEAFEALVNIPQIVGMKDSHRDTMTFIKLQQGDRGQDQRHVQPAAIRAVRRPWRSGVLVDRCLDGAVAAVGIARRRRARRH
jgi:dihydrodipicolinate synthase/N-acetylneuraminate lyase